MAIPYMDYNLCRLYSIIFLEILEGKVKAKTFMCPVLHLGHALSPLMAGHVSAPPYYLIYL